MNQAERGAELEREWQATLDAWSDAFPERARALGRRLGRDGSASGTRRQFAAGEEIATRAAGQDGHAGVQGGGADDDRRRRRPRRVDLHRIRRRRPLLRQLGRAQLPVRDPRARDGLDRQRDRGARWLRQAVRVDLPDLQRLHAPGGPALGADGAARRLGLDARLGRPRRGRADPPAGRDVRGAARDPAPLVHPAGRRQRDGGRLAGRARAARTARLRSPSRGRRCRRSTAASSLRRPGSSAGRTRSGSRPPRPT